MLKVGTGDYYGFQFRKRENDLRICAWLSRLGGAMTKDTGKCHTGVCAAGI